MSRSILFVDDESRVLDGLQRMLRSLRNEWDMAFVTSGELALQAMAGKRFDVVVSDIRMPGMDGAELLTRIKDEYPDTIRFALSGQSDQETWLKTVNSAHQFLSKPCSTEKLRNSIMRATMLRDKLRNASLRKIVSGTGALPSPPRLYHEIMALVRRPDASVQEIAGVVERDVAMSAKILQLINSAATGLPSHVASPAQAVALLGLGTVRALVLLIHVVNQFKSSDSSLAEFQELFHIHSMRVSLAAHRIATFESDDKHLVMDSSVSGMLHDIGRLILAFHFPKRYMALAGENLTVDSAKFEEAERAEFGASHADVGAYLLAIWGLPDPIVEAVAFHHFPSRCSSINAFSPLAAVHVADHFVNLTAHGEKGMAEASLDHEFLARLGLQGKLESWRTALN